MPRKAEVEDADKKSRLTLAQLAAYDDVSTDVMIDNVSIFSRCCDIDFSDLARELT